MPAAIECCADAETQERRWDADQYRARARTLRKLALRTRSPEVRRDLMELALRHERLAAYLDAQADSDPSR
ncbi:MAG TPA: hypothetical protein VJ770_03950 [Stellaceae bacterium]|nr:hypothetical protein [Stellaceae bacterium]